MNTVGIARLKVGHLCAGGTSGVTHLYGSLIAKTVLVNGHCDYHFDEDLKVNGPYR